MRLLLANPNTTAAVTARMAQAAEAIAAPGTTILTGTATRGAEIIATRTEMAIAEHVSLETLARHAPGCNGAIIGASLDSGLRAAREALPIPVVGITEAALHTACLLGGRIGVLCTSPRSAVITREMIEAYGLSSRIAAIRALRSSPRDILTDPAAAVSALQIEALRLVEDLADTVILIGAVMAGLPAQLQPRVPVPVLEGVACAVPLLEGLIRLRLPRPTAGSYATAWPRRLSDIDPALQRLADPPSGT